MFWPLASHKRQNAIMIRFCVLMPTSTKRIAVAMKPETSSGSEQNDKREITIIQASAFVQSC